MFRAISEQLLRHAMLHYNEDGWDFVVECYTIEEIVETLIENDLNTIEKAIVYFGEIYSLHNERREEIQSL
jgi:hypothetical protein